MVKQVDPFYQMIATTIAREGRQILCIAAEGKLPAFYYTIGNALRGAPELLLIGNFEEKASTKILNKLSELMLEAGKRFSNGQRVNPFNGEHDLQVWDTTPIAKMQYTTQVGQFLASLEGVTGVPKEYMVQQVVLPDPKGRYPADKRCHRRYRVPVLRPTVDLMADMRSTLVH
jgi:hypothetical protein